MTKLPVYLFVRDKLCKPGMSTIRLRQEGLKGPQLVSADKAPLLLQPTTYNKESPWGMDCTRFASEV